MSVHERRAEALVTILRSLMKRTRKHLHARVNKDLAAMNRNEVEALITIAEAGSITMSGLAREIALSTSSATQIADKLLKRNIAVREHSSSDRRVVTIRLTPRGKALSRAFNAAILQYVSRALQTLNEQEQETLISLYAKIADRLQDSGS